MLPEKNAAEILSYYKEMWEKQYLKPLPTAAAAAAEIMVSKIIQKYGKEAFNYVVSFMHHRSRPYYLLKKHSLSLVLTDEEMLSKGFPVLYRAWKESEANEEKAKAFEIHEIAKWSALEKKPDINPNPME